MGRLTDLGSNGRRRSKDPLQAGQVHWVEVGEVEVLDVDLVVIDFKAA